MFVTLAGVAKYAMKHLMQHRLELQTKVPGDTISFTITEKAPSWRPLRDCEIFAHLSITSVSSSNDNPAPAAAPRCLGSCPRSRCPAPGRGWRPGPRSPSSAGARRQTPAGSAQTSTMSRCGAGAHTGSFSSAHFPKVAAISDAACSAYYGPLGEGVGCVQGPSTCQVRATCPVSRVTCPLRVTRAAPC